MTQLCKAERGCWCLVGLVLVLFKVKEVKKEKKKIKEKTTKKTGRKHKKKKGTKRLKEKKGRRQSVSAMMSSGSG